MRTRKPSERVKLAFDNDSDVIKNTDYEKISIDTLYELATYLWKDIKEHIEIANKIRHAYSIKVLDNTNESGLELKKPENLDVQIQKTKDYVEISTQWNGRPLSVQTVVANTENKAKMQYIEKLDEHWKKIAQLGLSTESQQNGVDAEW